MSNEEQAGKDARYSVRQFERHPAMGGDPSEHDRACVLDLGQITRHPITGATQPKAVFLGTIAECRSFVRGDK